MKRTILFCGLMSCALVAGAEARSWGFDKDTVYEWKADGDAVRLVNNGTDTLRLDSVFAEEVNSWAWHHVSFFYRDQRGYSVSQWEPNAKVSIDSVPLASVLELYRFSVADILVKKSAESSAAAGTDTLRVRLRFKSSAGEMDTLIVVGFCCATTIKPLQGAPGPLGQRLLDRNISGRISRQATGRPFRLKVAE